MRGTCATTVPTHNYVVFIIIIDHMSKHYLLGPTLLFERFYSDKSSQRFFACAAYRSRKICSFYHLANDLLSPEKREQCKQTFTEYQSRLISQCNRGTIEASKQLLKKKCEDRCVCVTCGVLLVDGETEKVHCEHQIRSNLTNKELISPTMLLRPQNEDQGQAVCMLIC